jgi:DNA-binding NarL/FixJ family response regulator
MIEHVDYHVGILRGFILAHNAHQQVLHALDVVLTDYRSKAGPLIGAEKPQMHPDPYNIKRVDKEKHETDKINSNHYWTEEDEKELEKMYRSGSSVEDIANRFNCSVSNIYARVSKRGIKREHNRV